MSDTSKVDQAFKALIGKGEHIIRMGRPHTEFSHLRQKEIRVECSLDECAAFSASGLLSPDHTDVYYNGVLDELMRFDPSGILFTSFEPGQGTTFTCWNVARVLAKKTGEKVLVAEFYCGEPGLPVNGKCDMRASSLQDCQNADEFLCHEEFHNVYAYSCRSLPEGISGLKQLFNRFEASFDRILVDCSPAGHNLMSEYFCTHSAGTVLVCSSEPDPEMVKKFNDELRGLGGRFFGVVMNAVPGDIIKDKANVSQAMGNEAPAV